jgi:hypothetical protein
MADTSSEPPSLTEPESESVGVAATPPAGTLTEAVPENTAATSTEPVPDNVENVIPVPQVMGRPKVNLAL